MYVNLFSLRFSIKGKHYKSLMKQSKENKNFQLFKKKRIQEKLDKQEIEILLLI